MAESNLRSSDIPKLLKELNESSSPERIKAILKTFLICSSENKDVAVELLEVGAVEALIGLFNSEKGKAYQGQIACIFLLLSFERSGNEKNYVLEGTMMALSNIFSKSNTNVFLQCLSGIRDIAIISADNNLSFSLSSSSSSPSSYTSCFLSVSSSAVLFENASLLLSSQETRDRTKLDILDTLLQLVNTGVMSEAAEYVVWRQTKSRSVSQSQGGKSSYGGSAEISVMRFSKAFEDFAEVIKGISLAKNRTALGCTAKEVYGFIQEKCFFPTQISPSLKSSSLENQEPINFSLKFLANSVASYVTNSGNKLHWNSGSRATFFVDPEMNDGLYRISVVFERNSSTSAAGIGLSVKENFSKLASMYLRYISSGTCCMIYSGVYCGDSCVSGDNSLFLSTGKVVLGLELDANKHVLYFFVDEKQIPYCVVNVPPSVYFGVSAECTNFNIELKSLAKLTVLSINPNLSCAQYNWK